MAFNDFMNYFDGMHAAMQTRFDAMNRAFERVMQAPPPPEGSSTYSKTVTRSYSGPGNCGEEHVVERDSEKGMEVRTRTRRIGDRSIQETETKDLATGKVEKSVLRQKLLEGDQPKFDEEWSKVDKDYMPHTRHLLHHGHDDVHAPKQLQEKPSAEKK